MNMKAIISHLFFIPTISDIIVILGSILFTIFDIYPRVVDFSKIPIVAVFAYALFVAIPAWLYSFEIVVFETSEKLNKIAFKTIFGLLSVIVLYTVSKGFYQIFSQIFFVWSILAAYITIMFGIKFWIIWKD